MELRKKFSHILLDYFEMVFILTAVIILVYVFVGQLLEVSGTSMLPNFHEGERLVAEKVSVKFKPLKRGEITIFKSPQNNRILLIKRVIATPGDTVKIYQGKIYLNGALLDEKYLAQGVNTNPQNYMEENVEYKVPEYGYILMGDNRGESIDSREFGPVSQDLIVGRAMVVYYPIQDFKWVN